MDSGLPRKMYLSQSREDFGVLGLENEGNQGEQYFWPERKFLLSIFFLFFLRSDLAGG